MKMFERFRGNLLGVRFALNVFIATTILWVLLRKIANVHPIWAIASMIAASDPKIDQAVQTFRGRIINALMGCAVGLLFLIVGGSSEWKLPLALAVSVLLSSYVIHVQVMWRQAPITAVIVIASGLTQHSKISGVQHGLQKVAEVIVGCLMGLLVSWVMSKVWPMQDVGKQAIAVQPSMTYSGK